MASNSGRRSASSGDSRKRRSVYISGRANDRALSELREDAARERTDAGEQKRKAPGKSRRVPRDRQPLARDEAAGSRKGVSAAQRTAESRRSERETRHAVERRSARLRAASIAAAVIAVVAGCWMLYSSSLFSVSRIEVEGTKNLSVDRVRALARVPARATLLRFPADAVGERVEADPWVASVTVTRLFPDGMRIRVVEREPVVMVDAGATFWLVDRTGMIIAQRSAEQTGTYIVVRDVPGLDPKAGRRTASEPLLNAVNVLTGLSEAIVAQVKSVSAPTVDGTTLYTDQRIEIVIGEASELQKKSELVLTILREQHGKVVSIDVRTTDRPTWRGLPQ